MGRSRIVAVDSLQQFAAINLLSDPGHIAGPVIIPNAVRVRFNWTVASGKVAHNILYCTYTGTPALSVALADTIRAAVVNGVIWTTLAGYLGPGAAFQGVTLLDVRSTTGTEITSTGAASPGTSAQVQMPSEVALAVTIRTANRGPSGRGRFYVPGWAGNALSSTDLAVAAAVTALQNWASTNVLANLNANMGPMVLALPARGGYTSALTGRVFPPRAATSVPVTSLLVRNATWDSQRRRGLK